MGGCVAITIRFTAEHTYRGSAHTNPLPLTLLAAPFYVDLDTSREHACMWLEATLERRRRIPDLEQLWGGHNMLAPLDYGLILVDYVTSTLISAQGYASFDHMFRWGHEPAETRKWNALKAAGLLSNEHEHRPGVPGADIKLPFANTKIGDVDLIDEVLQAQIEQTFTLSDVEKAAWAKYIEERRE